MILKVHTSATCWVKKAKLYTYGPEESSSINSYISDWFKTIVSDVTIQTAFFLINISDSSYLNWSFPLLSSDNQSVELIAVKAMHLRSVRLGCVFLM